MKLGITKLVGLEAITLVEPPKVVISDKNSIVTSAIIADITLATVNKLSKNNEISDDNKSKLVYTVMDIIRPEGE